VKVLSAPLASKEQQHVGSKAAAGVGAAASTSDSEVRHITVRHAEVLDHIPIAPSADGQGFYGELVNAVSIDQYTVQTRLHTSAARDAAGAAGGTIATAGAGGAGGALHGFEYIYLQPEFTTHGFRYASITGLSPHTEITIEDVQGVVLGANVSGESGASVKFSHPVLNKVQWCSGTGYRGAGVQWCSVH
jgi:hypothetical protein